ncbi:MAG: hypothetical protein R2769_10790 [Saprospiraceae bacterium]
MGDLNQDGVLEMVVGNRRGGISIFKTNLDPNGEIVNSNEVFTNLNSKVYPNPAKDFFIIESEKDSL